MLCYYIIIIALLTTTTTTTVTSTLYSKELCFATIGDWGRSPDVQQEVADSMAAVMDYNKCSFVLSAGDNIYQKGVSSVADPKWKSVFEDVYHHKSLQVPWYAIPGNHDYGHKFSGIAAQIAYSNVSNRWNMPNNYFEKSFDLNGGARLHLVMIDTVNFTSVQQDWIQKTLSLSTAEHLVVVGHYPIYSGGHHGNVMEHTLLKKWVNKYEVSAYICGHDHDLQHLRDEYGVDYFVSGGGSLERDDGGHINQTVWHTGNKWSGFQNCTVTANNFSCSFISQEGAVLHSMSKSARKRSNIQLPPIKLDRTFDQLILNGDKENEAWLRFIYSEELHDLNLLNISHC